MSNYLFSKSTLAFYPVVLLNDYKKAGTLPDDMIEVADNIRDTFNASPPAGLKLGVDDGGLPSWIELSTNEMAERNEQQRAFLRRAADDEIEWRQDAVDADIATTEEATALLAWKKYRVLLMRVDTAAPVWPTSPVA